MDRLGSLSSVKDPRFISWGGISPDLKALQSGMMILSFPYPLHVALCAVKKLAWIMLLDQLGSQDGIALV